MADKLAEEQLRIYEERKAQRDGKFMSGWQTLSQYFLPSESNVNVDKTEDVVGWTDRIFDTTAIQANQTLAAGQRNWLTPSTEPWAAYEPPEELHEEGDEGAQWLAKASDKAMTSFNGSNFYSVVNMGYLGVGVFGTDLIFCEEGKVQALNFRHCKIGTYTIAEDDEGVVDSVHREFELSGRQAKQMFGEDALPDKMLDQMRGGKGLDKKFKFLHAVFPRADSDRLDKRADGANKPIASVYISIEFKLVVRESGYDEMPYLCSRFMKWGTDSPYGFSPAYLALPDARQLNYVVQYTDALAELLAYPRILRPSNLEGDVDLRAGGVTTFNIDNPQGIPKEWATVGNLSAADKMKEEKRAAINQFFYVDIFKRLGSNPLLDKKMTAFEISRREAEDLQQFTPAFDRRVTEFLNPLLKRVFGILYRAGKFGQAPDSLMQPVGQNKKGLVMPQIVITSRISMALKALQNRGTETTFGFMQPMLEQHPELLDNWDIDAVARDYSKNAGMSPDLVRTIKIRDQIRASRQQQMKAQQAMGLAVQAGKAGAGLGKAPQFMQDAAQQSMQQSG